jgi:hypothetical protein
MKSIEDTLKLIDRIAISLARQDEVNIALVGGYAAIAHGVERTTADVDFCIYTEIIHHKNTPAFIEILKNVIPETFELKFIEGGKIMDDPFKHDVIFLHDRAGGYPKIDLIIAKYKWELEGMQQAKPLEDIPFPVLPKPYLITMKLKAGSLKDDFDVVELYNLLTEEEKAKTHELVKLIKRDEKLSRLLKPKKIEREKEDKDLLL